VLAAAGYFRDVARVPAILTAIILVAGHAAVTTLVRTLVLVSLVRHRSYPFFLVNKRVSGMNALG
jgi:hypothetical protein